MSVGSDALGVKLGHRRVRRTNPTPASCRRQSLTSPQKLQRRIANSRGLAPEASLVSPTRANAEDAKVEAVKPEQARPDAKETAMVTKRKYRRHPKVCRCPPLFRHAVVRETSEVPTI